MALFSFKTIFSSRKPATVLKAFSGADLSRARSFRVHRRPLTGSTAGITPGLVRRGLSGEKNGGKKTSAKNTEWEGRFAQCRGPRTLRTLWLFLYGMGALVGEARKFAT